jgi:hypothetical protein
MTGLRDLQSKVESMVQAIVDANKRHPDSKGELIHAHDCSALSEET